MKELDWQPGRILVLEDDSVMRESLQDLLEDEGYEVAAAANGGEALSLCGQWAPDLIVFDIRMEGPDGLETLSTLQASGTDIPSLAITGYAAEDDSIRALRLGVGDYLKKPFRPEQLLHSVSRLLARHRHDQALLKGLRDLRETALWASRADQARELSELVAGLAQAAGLSASQAPELEIVAQLHAFGSEAFARPDCPERVREWVACLSERYDGSGPAALRGSQIPLQSRVLALALAAARGQHASQILKVDPGHFDPLLLEALGRLRPEAAGRPRLQLKLAQTLRLQGRPAEARELLTRLSQDVSEWGVEAHLSLARLAGQGSALLDHLRQAVDLARQVGPLCHAHGLYRSGLLLRVLSAPQAITALQQAEQRLEAAGLRVEAALCQILQGRADSRALELVLRPEHERQLLPVLEPVYLSCRQNPDWERLARRFLNRYPFLEGQTTSQALSQNHLRVVSFGDLQVRWGDFEVEESHWRGPLAKYLFAYLAAHERPVLEEVLLDVFWPEHTDNARRRLSGALSSLRRTLNPEGKSLLDPILRQRDRYCLNPSLEPWTDLWEFDQAREQARQALRQGEAAAALLHYRRMAELHSSPYLEGCYMDWAVALRDQSQLHVNEALLHLGEAALARRDFPAALEDCLRCIQWDEFQPRAQNVVLRAYVGTGQADRAVRHFQLYEARLRREMQLEPTLELLEAFHLARLAMG